MTQLNIPALKVAEERKRTWGWYQKLQMSPQKLMGANQSFQTTKITPGTMIAFFYDPKTKDKLPYYDTFPMNLPFSVTATHFTCLNLHYLHPSQRKQLLDKLVTIKENKHMQEKATIRISWELISNVAKFPEVQHCVKSYLFGHVKSNFIVIPKEDWHHAIFLPLERFKKATNAQVWGKSR